jgi:ubiquinone/menaquinone biosynthesis C-methylase UbiE
LKHNIERIQRFYSRETALVTSPFITQLGEVNLDLLSDVFRSLDLQWDQGIFVDVGCGTGMMSSFITPEKFYMGLDVVRNPMLAEMLDECHYFAQADAQYIPLKQESVNTVICVDSFEHYFDPYQAAAEFYRILKPDGALFLSVPNYANMAGIVKKMMEKWGGYAQDTWAPFDYWKREELEHFITPKTIKRVFSAVGFKKFLVEGYADEVKVALCPWIWHPAMPAKLERIISLCFGVAAKPIASAWPSLSLHNFWKITKK